MSTNHILTALALATGALAAMPASAAKTINEVGTCVQNLPTFPTIGAAVTASPKNATIEICPGTYPEQITITKNLTLTAVDTGTGGNTPGGSSLVHITVPSGGFVANATDVNGQPIAAQLVIGNAAKATITGLGFDASGSTFTDCSTNLVGIFVLDATATLQNNAVLNDTLGAGLTGCQDGEGILVESAKLATAKITGNHVAGFDKDGITIKDATTSAMVATNTIQGGGPTTVAAQNGVEVASGANATVSKNVIADFVYGGADYAASSVLIYDAPAANVSFNVVNEGQYGIVVYSDGSESADNPIITHNRIGHTTVVDAIEVCGANGATVDQNMVTGSALSAIHIDGSCSGSGASDVSGNILNYACAGVLNGAVSTNIGSNTFYNTAVDVSASDSCPAGNARAHRPRRPAPRG